MMAMRPSVGAERLRWEKNRQVDPVAATADRGTLGLLSGSPGHSWSLQSRLPRRPHPCPSGLGSRCQLGPDRRAAAAILLLGHVRRGRLALKSGPSGLGAGNNSRPSSRAQSPLALLCRAGSRRFGAFDLGPSGLLGHRHPGSHGGRPAMFLREFNRGR